jgi:hypothetical protein
MQALVQPANKKTSTLKENNMVRRICFIITVLAALLSVSSALASPPPTNVQVNQVLSGPFPKNKQIGPSLAQNPNNPLNLIAGSLNEIGEPACTNTTPSSWPFAPGFSVSGFYASFDGGKTWPCQGLLDFSAFGEYARSSAAQAFDSKGNAYYGTQGLPNPVTATSDQLATGLLSDIFVAKSTDGGCSYPTAARVSGATPVSDDQDPAIAADSNPGSPFKDNVYVAWARFTTDSDKGSNQILFSRSTDGGATYSNPKPISFGTTYYVGRRDLAAVKVGPDGTVYVVWLDTVNKQVVYRLAISHDGGQTFRAQNITVAVSTDDFVDPLPGSSFSQFTRLLPSLSIAPNGTLYVAWGNRTGDPTGGHAVVLLAQSTDSGLTWSAPVVAGDVSGRSAFVASVAADPNNNVNVAFTALDDVPTGTAPGAGVVHFDTYLTRSTNGGASFSSPLLISAATSDPDGSSTNSLVAQTVGGITAVADASHVYVVWTDSRNATPCAAVDAYRAGTGPKPNVITQCPTTFGNTDIFLSTVTP